MKRKTPIKRKGRVRLRLAKAVKRSFTADLGSDTPVQFSGEFSKELQKRGLKITHYEERKG